MLKQDRNFENVQTTLLASMGPISEIWKELDEVRKKGGQGYCDLSRMLELLEKAIICIGQANVHLNYFRRLPLVAKLMGSFGKAQKLLKKNRKR